MAIKGLSIRIDETLLHKIHVAADYEGQSANSEILILIRDAVKAYEAKHGKLSWKQKNPRGVDTSGISCAYYLDYFLLS